MTEPTTQTAFCCETMEFWSEPSDQHKDSLIYHSEKTNMPAIRLFDSKGGFVVIVYCPWCGKQIFDDTGLGGVRVRHVSGGVAGRSCTSREGSDG